MESEIKGTMNIGGKIYITEETVLPQAQLRFYAKNPRVYSELIKEDGEYPDQSTIESYMTSTERTKELKERIKANGGLINPVIVRKGDYAVLEGNTRLAAYRILVNQEPENENWKNIKCVLLPEDISENDINILLGAYHIKGTKDWEPYEQAGHLYRWHKTSKLPLESMAKQMGLTKSTVENMIKVYTFMNDHDDLDKSRWSYYEEYLKNKGINKLREENENFDIVFVNQVINSAIPSAQYVRKIGDMGKLNTKTRKKVVSRIVSGEETFVEAYERIAEEGKLDNVVKKLEKFRTQINEESFENQLMSLTGTALKDAKFNVNKIIKTLNRYKRSLDEIKDNEN